MPFDLFSKKDIQELLKKHDAVPSKGLGQNFLASRGIAQKIIESADIKAEDTILEIGPGIGNLTQELAKSAKNVVAVEKDQKMAEILKETLADFKNVEIVNTDFLDYAPGAGSYNVVANLPYYITSPAIRKFLEGDNQPGLMVLMVQKEVARRICAKPPRMNLLAVSVQFYAKPKIAFYVKKENFWPKPKVDSAVIKIILGGYPESANSGFTANFFRVAKAGFSQPRKQLLNNLSSGLDIKKEEVAKILEKAGISPKQRAETLSIGDWIKLSDVI
jgi:16S rRNA (adenine1518-N6/adenine1519-N6)-dimethyltransferase